MNMNIMLDAGAKMPTRAHRWDAGLDLYSTRGTIIPGSCCNERTGDVNIGSAVFDTGVHVEIPAGFVGFIKSKSGLNVNHGLTADGVIDSGYTGSIKVKLYNHTATPYWVNPGDKIAQLVILPCSITDLILVDAFESTERGNNGFGSTGV